MASIITATVSSGLTQQADNSGVLQLASGTGNLVTVPSVTGTAMVSGNMPAFSASKQGGDQSVSSGTWTKITYDTEEFDTNNNFASSRFTPTIAGYYLLTTNMETNNLTGYAQSMFYKNGTYYTRAGTTNCSSQSAVPTGSVVLYMNGSTDYVEVYMYTSASGVQIIGSSNFATRFTGALIRSA